MKIEQLYTNCLAQGAYYIESNGEAAVIDPLREVQQYIDLAASRNAKIKYIFETHFHADFVSGHVTLAQKTGATIVYGPLATPTYDCKIAKDGEEFLIGEIRLKAIHTPGHTMESTCYLAHDSENQPIALFSGDTLFLGDVGRPDLAQKATDMTQEDLAGILFESLRNKIMTLPDSITIYPGHGAGSACGKNMSKETIGNLGEQKQTNYALRSDMTKDEFIKELTDGLMAPPAYFPMNVQMNKNGYDSIDKVLERSKTPLSPTEVKAKLKEKALLLDVRHQNKFSESHVPGSIFIGLDGQFAPWVGSILKDVHQPLILLVDDSRVEEAITRLARVGFDQVIGYLEGGIENWKNAGFECDNVKSISADQLNTMDSGIPIVDVRKDGEYEAEHVENALHFSLDDLEGKIKDLPKDPFMLHCAGGYRSVIAISLLKRAGVHRATDILGGFGAIKQTELPTTNFVCPSTLKN
ncbi:MAG: MBL fold metallo-hydrolase [Bacteroidetes bacterium]|nr:MBL fold metallo-hydrolase [Bacteroidota bacterium]